MRNLTRLIDSIKGRTGVHLVDPELQFIKKDIPTSLLPRNEDVVYFDQNNYEVTRVLHNFENNRHTILIVIVPLPQRINTEASISFG